MTIEDGIHRCVQCDAGGRDTEYTHCANCGSINCPDHIKTERLEGTPVCTACAVTERFALRTEYFSDEENLEAFRIEYEQTPLHEKARENTPLTAGALLTTVLVLLLTLFGTGML